MCSKGTSTTVESLRERSPSSYSLKIQDFSQLENSTIFSDGKYESRIFSSGGYNWCENDHIYTRKGNDKDNGSGFISMYLEIDSTSLPTPSTEVFADFRFFVFNINEQKYFTIHDVESKPFSTFRPMWGIPQVLPLDTFKDPGNGFLFTDLCEFGVDVIVAPPPTKWETLSFNNNLSIPKFSWTVKNFSELKENCYTSSNFSMGGKKWALILFPKGVRSADEGKWISIYLTLNETLEEDEKIFKQASIRIIDPRGYNNHFSRSSNRWHSNSYRTWGYPQVVPIDLLSKTYLDMEGALNIEVEFDVVSTTEFSIL